MKILGISAHTNEKSISLRLLKHVLVLFNHANTELLNLVDYESNLHSIDNQTPIKTSNLSHQLETSNLIIIALEELKELNNLEYQNLLTNLPNINSLKSIPILLISTSLNKTEGVNILTQLKQKFNLAGLEIIDSFTLPNFKDNFSSKNTITTTRLSLELIRKINNIKQNRFKPYFKIRKKMCGVDTEGFENCDSSPY